jgi:preprotein translocase subunit SecY
MRPGLGRRIGFTLGALLVYRLGLLIPLPGIDVSVWEQLFRSQAGGILGAVNVLSGGALARLSILALNVFPYLSAAVLIQLMTTVGPQFGRLKKEGRQGRTVTDQYTWYLTVLLAVFQSYGIAIGLEGAGRIVSDPGWMFRISTTITLTGGTMFLMWLCDLIRARGVGHGLSLILCLGIVVEVPAGIAGVLELFRQGVFSQRAIVLMGLIAVCLTALTALVERARRRLPVTFPNHQAGRPAVEAELSLKLNSAGALIPTWLASLSLSLLYLVVSLVPGLEERSGFLVDQFAHRGPLFLAFYALLIFVFVLLYTAFVLSPDDTARALEKHGGRLTGAEPGEATAAALDRIFSRITLIGAAYLVLVCLVPEILVAYMGVPFYFGGASLLIVVCTVLDLDDESRAAGMRKSRG